MLGHNSFFKGLNPAIVREKMPKFNIIGNFSSRMLLKKISDKILLDNNVMWLIYWKGIKKKKKMCIIEGYNSKLNSSYL